MTTTRRVRRQHVVSRFYLKGFANDNNRIRRISLFDDAIEDLATSDVSVIKDFYTVVLPDNSKSDMFERAFSDMENAAAAGLRSIVAGTWPISGQRRLELAAWIALQHLRTEGIRGSHGSLDAQMISLIVGVSGKGALRSLIEKAERRPISDDELDWEWQDLTKPGGPEIVPDSKAHMRLLGSLIGPTTELMHDCRWQLFRFARRRLITSDHPVSFLAGPDYPSWQGVGLATADGFLVPLTRDLAMILWPPETLPAGLTADIVTPGTTKIARGMNAQSALTARRYIYHHPDDAPLDGMTLPSYDPARWNPRMDHHRFVREEGLFHGMSTEDQATIVNATREKRSLGITINDLEWPIPGRIVPKRPA